MVLILVLGVSVTALARERVELLAPDYPPFAGGTGPGGLWCELVSAALGREGVDVGWEFYPLERMKAEVLSGANPGFVNSTLVITPEEAPRLAVSPEPFAYADIVAFYPIDRFPRGLGLHSPVDLRGLRTGAIRGTGSVAVLTKAGVSPDLANDVSSLLRKLVVDRTDVAVVADLAGLAALDSAAPGQTGRYGYESVYRSPIDLIVSRARGIDLQTRFLQGMRTIRQDGTYLAILERYYPPGKVNHRVFPTR
jgi:ABC-type amino acid transport substrate-binding protein